MAKFDYVVFDDGWENVQFVAHAKKYTPEEVVTLCINEDIIGIECTPRVENVYERHVRYYPKSPSCCSIENGGYGMYSFCEYGERGSFPVYVLDLKEDMYGTT